MMKIEIVKNRVFKIGTLVSFHDDFNELNVGRIESLSADGSIVTIKILFSENADQLLFQDIELSYPDLTYFFGEIIYKNGSSS